MLRTMSMKPKLIFQVLRCMLSNRWLHVEQVPCNKATSDRSHFPFKLCRSVQLIEYVAQEFAQRRSYERAEAMGTLSHEICRESDKQYRGRDVQSRSFQCVSFSQSYACRVDIPTPPPQRDAAVS